MLNALFFKTSLQHGEVDIWIILGRLIYLYQFWVFVCILFTFCSLFPVKVRLKSLKPIQQVFFTLYFIASVFSRWLILNTKKWERKVFVSVFSENNDFEGLLNMTFFDGRTLKFWWVVSRKEGSTIVKSFVFSVCSGRMLLFSVNHIPHVLLLICGYTRVNLVCVLSFDVSLFILYR